MEWYKCCRGRRSACPEVAVDGDRIYIKDDDNSIISLTALQLIEVKTTAEWILNQQARAAAKATRITAC